MRDSDAVGRLAALLAAEYSAMPAGNGAFMSLEAVALRERDITQKVARRLARNHLAALNAALQREDAGLSVQISSAAPWGGLSFLVRRQPEPAPVPRFAPWHRWAMIGVLIAACLYGLWASTFIQRIWPYQLRGDIESLRVRVEQLEEPRGE